MKKSIGSLAAKKAFGALACAMLAIAGGACGDDTPSGFDPDAGTIQPDGGPIIVDEDAGIWEEEECDGTGYVSNRTAEPAGENCKWGGTKVDMGLDLDCSGALEPGEILATSYECTSYMETYSYTLSNLSERTVVMDLKDSHDIQLQVKDKDGNPLVGGRVVLTISMDEDKSLSFKRTSASYSNIQLTDDEGIANATIYSNQVESVGTVTAMALAADGSPIECNSVTISVKVEDQSEEEETDAGTTTTDAGTQTTDAGTDTDAGTIVQEGYGSLAVKVKNESSAAKAEINAYYVDGADSTPYCDTLRAGNGIGYPDATATLSISTGSTGVKTFKKIPAGKKVVVHAIGLTSGSTEVGTDDCVVSSVVAKDGSETLNLTLGAVASGTVDLDQEYDTLLHLNLTSLFPESWKKWFDLVDGLFQSPVGTAVYYALYYWEYHGQYAGVGGGSDINFNKEITLPFVGTIPLNISLNAWDSIISNGAATDPSVSEVLEACGITSGAAPTADCPTLEIPINVSLISFNIGPYQLFPLAVNTAEEYLNGIEGFGAVYDNIKTVGSNITAMAKSFDIGSRFTLEQTSESAVKVNEKWSHVIWTWQLGDDSPECTKGGPAYDMQKCGRHALSFADSNLASSVVNQDYTAVISGSTASGTNAVTLTLASDHSFLLYYGAMLESFLNQVVIPQVMNRDADGLNSDGEAFTQPVSSGTDLGDLLNYWIPCTKVSTAVYDKIVELLNKIGQKTDEAGNVTGGYNLGNLISNFMTAETLDGYCEMGLNTAADFAMEKLETLVADANLKVRAGSTFQVTDIGSNMVPKTLNKLNYQVGMTVDKVDDDGNVTGSQSFNAKITGEGILAKGTPPDIVQCADFMHLSDEAALAACD